MATAFTPGLQVSSHKIVRCLRELPVQGEVVVQIGDSVVADQTVARAELPGELYILRISETLGIEPFEVMKGLKVKTGDLIRKGQAICEHAGLFGLFRSRFEAPISGTIDLIAERTGHVGLRLPARQIEIDAYISGKIAGIEAGKAATIETQAAYVQGIFGVGGERQGQIALLPVAANKNLEPGDLPADCKGKVLVGGTCPSGEFLRRAAEAGAAGLVTGSIDDSALKEYLGYDLGIALTGDEDISMTVIVTEGFGRIELADRILNLLSRFETELASVNGATQVRAGAVRPEIIIPHTRVHTTSEREASGGEGLYVGREVRIIRVPYFGMRATVTDLPHIAQQIETGAMTRVLVARLEDGSEVTVPRANIELV